MGMERGRQEEVEGRGEGRSGEGEEGWREKRNDSTGREEKRKEEWRRRRRRKSLEHGKVIQKGDEGTEPMKL